MIVCDWEWMLSEVTYFHTMDERFYRAVHVRAFEYPNKTFRGEAFIAEREQTLRKDPSGKLLERKVELSRAQVEKLMQLTEAAGIFGKPLEHWAYVDDSDYETRQFLTVTRDQKTYGWKGQMQIMGYEGPGSKAINELMYFLEFPLPLNP